MSKHRIAIISDTHSLLRSDVIDILKTCEVILHAGDIASKETYDEISSISKTYFVRGNADKAWAEDIPVDLDINLFGFSFYMVHNKAHAVVSLHNTDFFIYGHSHKYEDKDVDGIHYLNPGSCGPRRFFQEVTMAVMTIDDENHSFEIEKIDLSPIFKSKEMKLPSKDLDRLIKAIIKDMDAGRTVDDIAKRNRVEKEFVNQILQIYTTHPGIDVDGIMNRLDIWGK